MEDITCTSSTQPVIYMTEYELCKMWQINYFYTAIGVGFILFFCLLSIYFNLHRTAWLYIRTRCYDFTNPAHNNKNSSETFMQLIQHDELVLATDNWNSDRILGEGGFGVVYKGNWRHTDVAIKRLKANVSTQ